MKKSTKGAVAAAAAGALLLGGAGSLAYWSDADTIAGGTFKSGELALGTPDCDGVNDGTANTAVWKIGGATYVAGTTRIVPGDKLSKECFINITAKGDNLTAGLAVTTPPTWAAGSAAALTAKLVPSAVFTVAGVSGVTVITDDDDTTSPAGLGEIKATVSINFPFDGDTSTPLVSDVDNTTNATGGLTAILDQVTVTATQQPLTP